MTVLLFVNHGELVIGMIREHHKFAEPAEAAAS